MILDIDALRAAPVANDPFQHVVVAKFIPPTELNQIVADLPDIRSGGSLPPSSLKLGSRARDLMAEMDGSPLREAIAEKFDIALRQAPTMVTLRGCSRERDGQIHCDSTAKIVTVLLYLNPADASWFSYGGSLRLLRDRDDIENYAVEVPPVDGTLLVFPNGPKSWHGHKRHIGRRYVVQLNYMAADAAARSELRRHRISAFLKRFGQAA